MLPTDLSGTMKASSYTEYKPVKVITYLFLDNEVGYGPERSKVIFVNGYGDIPYLVMVFCSRTTSTRETSLYVPGK